MQVRWYSYDKDKLYKKLDVNDKGLTDKQVQERLKRDGYNELPSKKSESIIVKFFKQLLNPIEILLVVTIILSLVIGEIVDAVAIIFIVLVDLVLGVVQEYKAEKSALALQKMIIDKVKVWRNNEQIEIPSRNLVVGDIIFLESGDQVNADARLINCDNLQVNEAVLTGESYNEYKNTDIILKEVTLAADVKNMVYAGTTVMSGRGKAIVVATGLKTEIGKIADSVNSKKDTKTPLTIRVEKFSKQISLVVVIVAFIVAFILMFKNVSGDEIFLSVVALSVSAMPEGLPLALTLALTVASSKMAKQNVIVKKLNAVETLGSCTVIATDKTGTLTVNEQTAKKVILPDGTLYDIEGTGYNDDGEIKTNDDIDRLKFISKLGIINNEATLEKKDQNFKALGDSIDIAFLALGMKTKVNKDDMKIIKQIPYESENKFSAVFYEMGGKIYCTVKGSLEVIMNYSKYMDKKGKKSKIDADILLKQNDELAQSGYRVIALANGVMEKKDNYDISDIKDLTFMGMVAFIDPIRKEVKQSISECRDAGIKVIMITGDHPLTGYAIAHDLGLVSSYNEVATGVDVSEYLAKGQKKFDDFIRNKRVFTRVTPLDKLEIVESLKRQGEFVAVTGDGVNDAPAIKSANIGVAMGSGTDVSKETAFMIVTDDNFKSIVVGVKEGRTAYSNIRKVAYMLLSCGIAEVLFFILSIILDLPMPLVAVQLLWLNIVTDGLQDFALSFEKTEKNIMKEKPKDPKEAIFNKSLFTEVIIAGLTMGIIVFIVWFFLIDVMKMDVGLARGYIMVLMVFMQNVHVLNCKSETQSIFKMKLRENPLILVSIVSAIVLQIIIMEVPFLSSLLQTSTVPIMDMVILFIIASIVLFVMETYKMIKYRKS